MRSIAQAVTGLFLAFAAPASAAPAICSPATCGDAGKSRSVELSAPAKRKQTSLRVTVKGAPTGARVTVTGPRGFKRVIARTTTFRKVRPGAYVIVAAPVTRKGVTTF